MKTPEGKVKDEIKAWLKENGIYFFMPVQMGMGAATLDIIACYAGLFIAIEVKSRVGKPTARQLTIAERIGKAGGIVIWARSLEDVTERIRYLPC